MSLLEAIYKDYSVCCDDFSIGISCLRQRSVDQAAVYFRRAWESVSDGHPHRPVYLSYYGYALLLNGDNAAIDLCRQAARLGSDTDIFYILARAEMFCKNREQMVWALEQGLLLDAGHPGLLLMQKLMGQRKIKPIPFLPRASLLNRGIGRLLRKK